MKNKKGQLGDGITWVVAFGIIVFMIFLFVGAVILLIPVLDKNELKISQVKGNNIIVDLKQAENIKEFADANEDKISQWADNLGDKSELENKIKESSKDFFDTKNGALILKISTDDKEFNIFEGININVADAPSGIERIDKKDPIKLLIISKGGKVITITLDNANI